MKLNKIAVATVLPATVAGALLAAVPFAQAAPTATAPAPVHAPAPAPRHPAAIAKPTAAKHHKRHHARIHHVTAVASGASARQGSDSSSADQAQSATASQPLSAGESSFEQCVSWRESSNTPTDPDGLFGILPSTWAELGYSGTAGQASVAQQKVAFNRLYAEYGTQPWAPSDGC